MLAETKTCMRKDPNKENFTVWNKIRTAAKRCALIEVCKLHSAPQLALNCILKLLQRSILDFRNGASSIAPGNHQERRSDRRSDCSSKNVRRSNALEIAFALQGRSARKVCFQNCFKRHNSKRASKRLSFKASFTFCKKRNGGRRPALEIVLLRRQTFY